MLTWKETLLASTSRKSTKLLHTVSFISISSCTIRVILTVSTALRSHGDCPPTLHIS